SKTPATTKATSKATTTGTTTATMIVGSEVVTETVTFLVLSFVVHIVFLLQQFAGIASLFFMVTSQFHWLFTTLAILRVNDEVLHMVGLIGSTTATDTATTRFGLVLGVVMATFSALALGHPLKTTSSCYWWRHPRALVEVSRRHVWMGHTQV